MKRLDPKRVTVFICVLASIAIVIYSAQYGRERQKMTALAQQQQQHLAVIAQQQAETANRAAAQKAAQDAAAERLKAAQDAAAQHANYLARYLNPGFTRTSTGKTVAVVAAAENGALDHAVTAALMSRFQKEPAELVSSFFKPAFVSDGLFQEIVNGSGAPFERLDLAHSLDGAVLAREDVQYAQTATLENVTTATMQLKVTVVPVSSPGDGQTWTFTAYGPGFTKEVARQAAEERLIKQIATDTNMTLNAITSNH